MLRIALLAACAALMGCADGGFGDGLRSRALVQDAGFETASGTAAAEEIAKGQALPYGIVRKVCGISSRDMGTKVASESGFTVYDSGGSQSAMRTHFLTGFDDNCARQFSAKLVMFGDVGTYEMIRYQTSGASIPTTETDAAYETLKARVCGVGAGEPCGDRLDALAKNTTFITAYGQFGGADNWLTALLHGGDVLAVAETDM